MLVWMNEEVRGTLVSCYTSASNRIGRIRGLAAREDMDIVLRF